MSDCRIGEPTVGVVLNPASGGGKTLKAAPTIVKALQARGECYQVSLTAGPGDAIEKARAFAEAGARVVIAVGGDGTINEVANGLVEAGGETALGIVPAGRGSDFARTVQTPKEIVDAVARACGSAPRRIDVGKATFDDGTHRYFLNVAGLGFDAVVAERAYGSRLPGSQLPYLSGLAGSLGKYRNIPVRVEANGETIETPAVFVVIANAAFFGGGLHIAPMASIEDGLLDLGIIGDISKGELLRQVPGVYRGKHVTHAKFTHRCVTEARVTTGERARVQLDGELCGDCPVTFSVCPGALQFAG